MKKISLLFSVMFIALMSFASSVEQTETSVCPAGTLVDGKVIHELGCCTIVQEQGEATKALKSASPWVLPNKSIMTITPNPGVAIEKFIITCKNLTLGNMLRKSTVTNATAVGSNNPVEYHVTNTTEPIIFTLAGADENQIKQIDFTYTTSTTTTEPEYDLEEEVTCPDLKVTEIEEEGVTIFIVKGRDEEKDSDVELYLKNYTGEDGEYEVDLANSFLTFGGIDVTLTAGTLAQTTDELGKTYYTGLVVGTTENKDENGNPTTKLIALDITMYTEETEEPEAEVLYDIITDMKFDLENMIITGGPSSEYGITVSLNIIENPDGTFSISAESSIHIGVLGEATLIDGAAYEIDAYAPAAKVDLVVACGGAIYQFHLDMSAAPMEATVVVVENATVEVEKAGNTYDYSLKMTGNWTDAEGLTYPVLVEIPTYYPEATEPSEILSTVTVGSWDEGANWLGFGEGDLTIETVNGVVTATGVVENPQASIAINITISGTLPQGPTGVENNTINVKAMKVIRDGQLIIRNNGVEFNAQGAIVK